MLNEKRAAVRYDPTTDTAIVDAGGAAGACTTADVAVLLDARGRLVGVDVDTDGPGRTVLMLGRHEDVASVVRARAEIARAPDGSAARAHLARARAMAG